MNKILRFTQLAAFTALTVSVIGLTGCSTTLRSLTQEEINASVAESSVYDQSHSRAWNIANQMGIGKYLKDAYIDDADANKYADSDSYTGVDKTIELATNFSSVSAVTAVLTLLTPTRDNYMDKPVYLGYMPKDFAADGKTASRKFTEEVIRASYVKAAESMGYEVRPRNDNVLEMRRPAGNGRNEYVFWLRLGAAINSKERVVLMGHEAPVPEWISDTQKTAWVLGGVPGVSKTTSMWVIGDATGTKEDFAEKRELMKRFQKNLPDNVFAYIPSMKEGRDGGATPAYIADNKRKYFFVMPKSAENLSGK